MKLAPVAALLAIALVAAGCGGSGKSISIKTPDPPVGKPLLPDIAPAFPTDVHIEKKKGRWLLSFSSILVNIGKGDFVLRAERGVRDWSVVQDIPYSQGGAKSVSVPAQLVWGGDGHGHWHIDRVAISWLVPLKQNGEPADVQGWVDAKVGFCFFDFSRQLETGPEEKVYSSRSCGNRGDRAIAMGLSRGWGDTYNYGLPGQNVDITDLPDGGYRLWAEADRRAWFREARRDNNVSWIDLELATKQNGLRTVTITGYAPPINFGG